MCHSPLNCQKLSKKMYEEYCKNGICMYLDDGFLVVSDTAVGKLIPQNMEFAKHDHGYDECIASTTFRL